jgi:hypothetical protein
MFTGNRRVFFPERTNLEMGAFLPGNAEQLQVESAGVFDNE